MITFKQFLAEEPEFYSDYPALSTSKDSVKRYGQEIAEIMGFSASTIKMQQWLMFADSFRITCTVRLSGKLADHSDMAATMLPRAVRKVLAPHFDSVVIEERNHGLTGVYAHPSQAKPISLVVSAICTRRIV